MNPKEEQIARFIAVADLVRSYAYITMTHDQNTDRLKVIDNYYLGLASLEQAYIALICIDEFPVCGINYIDDRVRDRKYWANYVLTIASNPGRSTELPNAYYEYLQYGSCKSDRSRSISNASLQFALDSALDSDILWMRRNKVKVTATPVAGAFYYNAYFDYHGHGHTKIEAIKALREKSQYE